DRHAQRGSGAAGHPAREGADRADPVRRLPDGSQPALGPADARRTGTLGLQPDHGARQVEAVQERQLRVPHHQAGRQGAFLHRGRGGAVSALRARLQALWARLQGWYAGHSQRDQRIIVGVLTLGATCVIYLYGVIPLREYRQRVSDEIAEGREQLSRSARILGSADSLRAERGELEKRLKQTRTHLL